MGIRPTPCCTASGERRRPDLHFTNSRRKHHRWRLDRAQVESYGLGSVLNPKVRNWWERTPDRPLCPRHPLPARLGHGPLRFPLHLLHAEHMTFLPKADLLTLEELDRCVRPLSGWAWKSCASPGASLWCARAS
jgi:hypothetical protein